MEKGKWKLVRSCEVVKVPLTGLCGFEAEAGVVGGPFALGIAELGAERFLDFGEVGVAVGGREFVGEIVGEDAEPGADVAG